MSKRFPLLEDRDWLAKAYSKHRSVAKVAKLVGCSASLVVAAMKRLGVARTPVGALRTDARLRDRDWLEARVKTMPANRVARLLGVHPRTVYRSCAALGVAIPKGRRWGYTDEP